MAESVDTNSAGSAAQGHLLVVDDNRVNRTLLASRLAKRGYTVGQAADGAEALAAVDAGHYDLVLLDIEMPGLSGFEVLQILRERFSRAELSVVMVTGREESDAIVHALDLGANDYVFKSAEFEVVFARVQGQLALKQALEQLQQARRMQSIGQLAGGLAHEINTPLQFISDNAMFISQAFQRLEPLLDACQTLQDKGEALTAGQQANLARVIRRSKLPMIRDQLPSATEEIQTGVTRVSEVVEAMRSFANPQAEGEWVPIHEAIQTTLTMARSIWRPLACVETTFDAELDMLSVDRHQLDQVILALLMNAAQAVGRRYPTVAEGTDEEPQGRIGIYTRSFSSHVEIAVADNGPGVPRAIRDRIFDPFFTTHDVGGGSGQGLALCQAIIVKRLGGRIDLTTAENAGATFTLRIPRSAEGFFHA